MGGFRCHVAGMLWVKDGEALWQRPAGQSGKVAKWQSGKVAKWQSLYDVSWEQHARHFGAPSGI